MELSKIGTKLSQVTGVRKIMNDIIKTLEEADGDIINMSAGNPVILPELETFWKKQTKDLLESEEFGEVIGRYGSTKGYGPFLEAMTDFANKHYSCCATSLPLGETERGQQGKTGGGESWTKNNLLVTTGSQSFYFFAINTFAGTMPDGSTKKVLLPQSPEYTGYGGMGLEEDIFLGVEPSYVLNRENKSFHYTVNAKNFPENKEEVGLIILSRPCNPTGNIISKEELKQVYDYVEGTNIPVLLDSAYAPPIPNLAYGEFETLLHPNVIICMSFSKAGLPGERVGIALGDEKFLKPVEAFESNTSIMSSRFGQAILTKSVVSGELESISINIIRPYYENKFTILKKAISENISNMIPYFLHETRGAMFGFVYFENLPITDEELYEKLKQRGVLFVPGNSFFIGVDKEACQHANHCMRLSITVSDEDIIKACKVLGEVLEEVY